MAALDLQIEVPNMGVSEIEELKHKLMAYAKKLISLSQSQSEAKREMPNAIHISPKVRRLVGRIPVSYSDEELEWMKDDYLSEKYGL